MTRDVSKEISRRMRGLRKDVDRLKGQRDEDGEVNLLFAASDTVVIDDSATLSVSEGGSFQTDSSSTDGSDLTG